MTCQTTKCKEKKLMPLLDFTSRRKVMIRGQDDVRSVYFVIIGWGRGEKTEGKRLKANLQHG